MKVSYEWLNDYFEGALPPAVRIADALTFHAWEIEEMEEKHGDTIIDVKVLPDKSAWALSHRGIAKDLSVILGTPLAKDPLSEPVALEPAAPGLSVSIETPKCARYSAALVDGVSVGPSPGWLSKRLESIGQRSINNVVDATNYVMFALGQPLHAFDAAKLQNGGATAARSIAIAVRAAQEGETITTLTGEEFALSNNDLVIARREDGQPLGIAGVKGGLFAGVDSSTTSLVLESANFDRVSVRRTSQRLKLRTDASYRFENGILPSMTPIALSQVVALILEIAGGKLVGYADEYPSPVSFEPVAVSMQKVNSVLGLSLSAQEAQSIIERFGYAHELSGDTLTVHPPLERPDLLIAEDLIEEIGRIHGYEHVASVRPKPVPLSEINKRFYYAEHARDTLVQLGFSEVFTSSFRNKDEIRLQNALASDKGYLRSSLAKNLDEALAKNAPLADLLGVRQVRVFEIGTVFGEAGEHVSLAFGVRSPGGYKAKADDPALAEARAALESALGAAFRGNAENGILEFNFDALAANLAAPSAYRPFVKRGDPTYRPFSPYPHASRDIALWVPEGTDASSVEERIRAAAGPLLVRTALFDEFKKDGKVSYAFRIVLQSAEQTLTEEEIALAMHQVAGAAVAAGWEVR